MTNLDGDPISSFNMRQRVSQYFSLSNTSAMATQLLNEIS